MSEAIHFFNRSLTAAEATSLLSTHKSVEVTSVKHNNTVEVWGNYSVENMRGLQVGVGFNVSQRRWKAMTLDGADQQQYVYSISAYVADVNEASGEMEKARASANVPVSDFGRYVGLDPEKGVLVSVKHVYFGNFDNDPLNLNDVIVQFSNGAAVLYQAVPARSTVRK